YPAAGMNASGDFVVVWQSYGQDGSNDGIFGQRFNADGSPRGAEFRVNTYTANSQSRPSVAIDGSGNFVLVWQSFGQDGSDWGIFGQRFGSNGARLGTEFQVNAYTTGYQKDPRVAADAIGNFVVVWNSYGQDGSAGGIFAQRF